VRRVKTEGGWEQTERPAVHAPKGRAALVVALKVIVSATLVAATIGLLWHGRGGPELWAHSRPSWWLTLAKGWYPDVIRYVGWLWQAGSIQSMAYGVVSSLCVLTIFALPFIGGTVVRVIASAIVVLGLGYDLTMFDIGGGLPSLAATDTILTNVDFGLQGTAQLYLAQVGRNSALAVVAMLVFCWPPPALPRRVSWIPLAVVLAATAGVAGIFWKTAGYTTLFPSPFTSFLNAYTVLKHTDRPIAQVDYPGKPVSRFRYIVFIVDESVRGDYLSINNPSIPTTPFLLSRRDDIANFGEAVSAANCSTDSRRALRFGYRDEDLASGRAAERLPPFWRHAKLAGLMTVHIDSYGTVTNLANDMTRSEAQLIDRRIVVQGDPQYLRDAAVERDLRGLLHDTSPKFIFVEKFGIHVPYDKMYPPAQNVFGADMTRFDLRDRTNMLRHYENGIRWSVDHFFETLLSNPIPRDTLILYTSDHGQSLMEEGRTTTHCNQGSNATKGEADVPLFAMTGDPEWNGMLQAAAHRNFGRTSHLQIFGTILAAMGYDRQWIRQHYGLSLLDDVPATQVRRFWATGAYRQYDQDR
jgi:glucan phosphoethanolaminetransferase (alkaline phosphatase superfamily)